MQRLTSAAVTGSLVALFLLWQPCAVAQQEFRLDESDEWVQTEAPEPGSPQAQLAAARTALAREQYERAVNIAGQWIERYPNHALLPEAYILRGDALDGRGDEYEALFDYEYVARVFPESEAFVTALERELEIAKKYAAGMKRKLWGMRILSAIDDAEELFIRIQERLPGSRLAEEAGITLGDLYFRRRDMDLAAEMYAIFIENHPRSELIDRARRGLIASHLASFKGPEFDAAGLSEARALLRELKVVDPMASEEIGADALLTRIDESMANKLLRTARWYLKQEDPIAAELALRRLILRYPGSVAAREALDLIRRMLPHLPKSVLGEAPDYRAIIEAVDAVETEVQP